MRIKSFIASTIQEALASVRREMGDSSIILETRNIEEGDIKSKPGQTLVEVVAAEQVFGRDKEHNRGEDTDQRQNSDQNTSKNVDENTGQKAQDNNGDSNLHSPGRHSPELCRPVQDPTGQSGSHAGKVMLADYFHPEDLVGTADLSPSVTEPAGDGEDDKSVPHTDQDVQSDNGDLDSGPPSQHPQDSLMRVVLEQYLHTVVEDKFDKMITKRFQEMEDNLYVLKKLQSDSNYFHMEIASLKTRASGPDIDIKEMLSKNGKKIVATIPATKKTATVKPAAKKPVRKKPVVKKKVATKKTATVKPAAKKPVRKKPVVKKKVATKKTATVKPAAKKSVTKKPVVKKKVTTKKTVK